MRVRRGFAEIEETVFPDRDGIVVITAKAGEPLAVFLDPDQGGANGMRPMDNLARNGKEGEYDSPLQNNDRFSACERVGSDIRPLPIGAQLDPQTGVFTWLPGPGFCGSFQLEFTTRRPSGAGVGQRVVVTLH